MILSVKKIEGYLNVILPPTQQLVMFLAGSGGTGKSRIIQAFTDFARRWHSTSSCVVCASTGIASILILGCTVHAALGVGIRNCHKAPTVQQKTAWSEIGVMFIDEFSMVSPSFFDFIDKRLRQLKDQPDKIFGGVHMILSGDFYQSGPVASPPIYKSINDVIEKPTTFKNGNPRKVKIPKGNLEILNGQELFATCLTDVIELNVNLRQHDQVYAKLLESLRVNRLTRAEIDLINSRDFYSLDDETRNRIPPFTITTVFENTLREDALRYCESKLLKRAPAIVNDQDLNWRKRGVLLIKAKILVPKKNKTRSDETEVKVTRCDEQRLRQIGSSKLKVPLELYCILDAPYMVSDNSDVSKGVANGTPCWLNDVILSSTATVRVITLPSGEKVHSVVATDVAGLIFKHKTPSWSKITIFPSLPQGCFPVTTYNKSVTLEYKEYKKRFQIIQYPCELSMVLTGHKVQGITTDSIIQGATHPQVQYGRKGWYYVNMSRVTSLNGLYLMEKIEEDPEKYIPRYDVEKEMKRLQKIENQTLARLESANK